MIDTVTRYISEGAVAVKGNHDRAVENHTRDFNDEAHAAIEWTRSALSEVQKRFLSDLPLIVRDDDFCFVHSTADAPDRWDYVQTAAAARESIDASQVTYTFAGHVHEQVLYFRTLAGKTAPYRPISGSPVPMPSHRGWHAIVGSVGQPRDGDPSAAYALFDSTKEEMTFFRVPYDHLAAAQKIRQAGFSDSIARLVENGR